MDKETDSRWEPIETYKASLHKYVIVKMIYRQGMEHERELSIPIIAMRDDKIGKWMPNYGPVSDYKFFNENCVAIKWMPLPL